MIRRLFAAACLALPLAGCFPDTKNDKEIRGAITQSIISRATDKCLLANGVSIKSYQDRLAHILSGVSFYVLSQLNDINLIICLDHRLDQQTVVFGTSRAYAMNYYDPNEKKSVIGLWDSEERIFDCYMTGERPRDRVVSFLNNYPFFEYNRTNTDTVWRGVRIPQVNMKGERMCPMEWRTTNTAPNWSRYNSDLLKPPLR